MTLVGQAATLVNGVQGIDPYLDSLCEQLTGVHCQLGDLARELHVYADGVSVDPARLEVVNQKLRLYMELGRKYGGSTDSAIQRLTDAGERLAVLEGGEADLSRLEEIRQTETARALECAGRLTIARRAAVPRLEEAVAGQLGGLGMAQASVFINLQTHPDWDGLSEAGAEDCGIHACRQSRPAAEKLGEDGVGR